MLCITVNTTILCHPLLDLPLSFKATCPSSLEVSILGMSHSSPTTRALSESDSPATGPAMKRDNMIRSNGLHNLIKNHPIYFLCPLPCSMSS